MSKWWRLIPMILAAGCASSKMDQEYLLDIQLAHEYYAKGKFEEAMRKYEDAIERNPKSYPAIVGLACADREWGLKKFAEAEDLYVSKKHDLAKKEFDKAVNVHGSAQRLFKKAIDMNPSEPMAYRERGVFYYKRATSPFNFPYRLDDAKNRRMERDKAIEDFEIVVLREPGALFAQRYLGLALFAKGESPKGRRHLELYLEGMAKAREYIRTNAPRQTPELREDAEKRLSTIDKELTEVCDMLDGYLKDLNERRRQAELVDRKDLVNELAKEMLAVNNLLRKYHEASNTKMSETPKQN